MSATVTSYPSLSSPYSSKTKFSMPSTRSTSFGRTTIVGNCELPPVRLTSMMRRMFVARSSLVLMRKTTLLATRFGHLSDFVSWLEQLGKTLGCHSHDVCCGLLACLNHTRKTGRSCACSGPISFPGRLANSRAAGILTENPSRTTIAQPGGYFQIRVLRCRGWRYVHTTTTKNMRPRSRLGAECTSPSCACTGLVCSSSVLWLSIAKMSRSCGLMRSPFQRDTDESALYPRAQKTSKKNLLEKADCCGMLCLCVHCVRVQCGCPVPAAGFGRPGPMEPHCAS